MATDLQSTRPRWRFPSKTEIEAAERVETLRARSLDMETTLLVLWDHIRELTRDDPSSFHAFLRDLDPRVKLETLCALKLMDEHDTRPEDEALVLGVDVSYNQIMARAASALSQHADPIAALIANTAEVP